MEMKTPLNPYASCYVPLSRQGKQNVIGPSKTGPEDSDNSDKTSLTNPSSSSYVEMKQNPVTELHKTTLSSEVPLNSEDWTLDANGSCSFQDEANLAYLASLFTDISEQSLADVYAANGGDLEASVSMLAELELPADFTDHPYTNLYNTPEFGTSLVEKITGGESSASASASASASGCSSETAYEDDVSKQK